MAEPRLDRWPASDGVELAWRELGEGRAVILLHGLFSSSEMNWIRFGHAERVATPGGAGLAIAACAKTYLQAATHSDGGTRGGA